MAVTSQTGDASEWWSSLYSNHYLTGEENTGFGDFGSDDIWMRWTDGEENYVIRLSSGKSLSVGAGWGDDGSWDFENRIYSDGAGDMFVTDSSDEVRWWYDSGSDWYWHYATIEQGSRQGNWIALGWQEVDKLWDYQEVVNSMGHALLHRYSGGDWEPHYCRIDDAQDGQNERDGGVINLQRGSLLSENQWAHVSPTILGAGGSSLANMKMVGTIDAWGKDSTTDRPSHLDRFTTDKGTFVYIRPGDGGMFFKES